MEDHQVQMTCAMVPFILLDAHTPRCVVGSLAIKLDILMPFTLVRSILPMLKELASLVAVHEHTYGHMLQTHQRQLIILYAHVILAAQAVHPHFVGNNYVYYSNCESGNKNNSFINYFLYADDPLWDGEDCSTEGTCCSNINGRFPPWFTVTLNVPTNDNIEVRICADYNTSEDTPIELLEIYIQ